MVDAGIATVNACPVFTDSEGNDVDESKADGRGQDIHIHSPEYSLFGDESGCSTNQKKDGHIAGTKYIVEQNIVTQINCCTNDHT